MGRLSHVAVVTLLALLLYGCGRDQDKVVTGYCKAIDAGKFDEATTYLSKDAKKVLESIGGKSRLAEFERPFKQHKGLKSIDITKSYAKGESARVEFSYNFNDGSKYADFFPLVKEDGTWKIAK